MKSLSTKQRRFCDEYLKGTPAGKAWELAGYKARGASATEQASRALKRKTIRDYLKRERSFMVSAARVERADLVEWLKQVVFTPMHSIDERSNLPQVFERVETDKMRQLSIRMPDKIGAIKLLCHLCGLGPPPEDLPENHSSLTAVILSIRTNHPTKSES